MKESKDRTEQFMFSTASAANQAPSSQYFPSCASPRILIKSHNARFAALQSTATRSHGRWEPSPKFKGQRACSAKRRYTGSQPGFGGRGYSFGERWCIPANATCRTAGAILNIFDSSLGLTPSYPRTLTSNQDQLP